VDVFVSPRAAPIDDLFCYTPHMTYSTLFFDVDDTLYPAQCGLWEAIGDRINLFMYERMGFPVDTLSARRSELFHTYGTTLRGLKMVYGVDEHDYLAFVHDVPLASYIHPDPAAREVLLRYPQRRLIFTNGDIHHACRVLTVLELSDCFEQIIDILSIWPYCKPQREAFQIALDKAGITEPHECILVDDSQNNLAAAREFGMYTVWVGSPEVEARSSSLNHARYDACVPTFAQLPRVLDPILLKPSTEKES
jgi:putative hydrolase of the HAD superfamily